jgi:nitrate reductase NapE component
VFFRPTRIVAAILIVALWLLALRDYPLFHLLDYLALGLAVAAYLFLDAMPDRWRKYRMTALRVGVAIALMWSSLEKFAYPEWFWPLTEERPYLTMGLARDTFIPMAGIAEFTLGFGMLWTPLIRRLSAIALFAIFTAAVYPFGRVDLVGHALIMAVLIAIAADHAREEPARKPSLFTLLRVPAGLVAALAVFVTAYWGLHMAIYGPEGQPGVDRSTHTHEEADQSSGVQ